MSQRDQKGSLLTGCYLPSSTSSSTYHFCISAGPGSIKKHHVEDGVCYYLFSHHVLEYISINTHSKIGGYDSSRIDKKTDVKTTVHRVGSQ
jgi:hypothetical protein